jgi:hypothetical protein
MKSKSNRSDNWMSLGRVQTQRPSTQAPVVLRVMILKFQVILKDASELSVSSLAFINSKDGFKSNTGFVHVLHDGNFLIKLDVRRACS